MKRKMDFRSELEASFVDWESLVLHPALDRAVHEIKFPEIRYYTN